MKTWIVGLAAVLMLAGCRNSAAPTPPYIRGQITLVQPSTVNQIVARILVEEDPTKTIYQGDSPKSMVSVGVLTSLRTSSGATIGAESFKVGQIVSVWTSGTVLDSYPDQVFATDIVVEKQ